MDPRNMDPLTLRRYGSACLARDRVLRHSERIVRESLERAVCGHLTPDAGYDLYAVEAGPLAIGDILGSLRTHGLLTRGDTIALAAPIFTPDFDRHYLAHYGLRAVTIAGHGEGRWQLRDEDLQLLLDGSVKAFFAVDPCNPFGVPLSRQTIEGIGAVLVKKPSLMLLTDDLFATFVPGFRSLLTSFPANTIGIYSFAKYFECSGWRLGVVAVHADNPFDRVIACHPGPPPGPVMTKLCSLAELATHTQPCHPACADILRRRALAMVQGLAIDVDAHPLFGWSYGLVDFEYWLRQYGGEDAVDWVMANVHPLDIVVRLAEDHGIALLNGTGFEPPDWSVRVPFANVDDEVYARIGRAVRAVAREYALTSSFA